METKYKLTDRTKALLNGTVLHRIEALRNGPWGPAGNFGGWIESERNLSQEGNCWVFDDACVYDSAKVYGQALVYGNSLIYGNTRVCEDAKVFSNANVSGNAMVSENAWVFGNARVFGDQKINGYCLLYGYEEGKKFKVRDLCICRTDLSFLEKYHGCCWEISQVYEGWVQAKHGPEEVAFRNNWLRKI